MGLAFAGQALISFALSYAAARLLRPRDKGLARDDKPTTTSERGARIPLLIGRDRVGPIIGWAGDRHIKKERIQGGKSLESPKQNVYYERSWHQLLVGPAHRLHKVRQHGKVIFRGPIDPVSHPSGSTISCGKEGSFRIFWGEPDQPVNGPPDFLLADSLAATTRVGVASRWPWCVYLDWISKRLGTSPTWSLLDYEMECRPATPLSGSAPWIEPTRTLSGSPIVVLNITNGTAGTATITVQGDHTSEFYNGVLLRLSGNTTAPDQNLFVLDSTYVQYIGTPPTLTLVNETTITLSETLLGAAPNGLVEAWLDGEDDGPNPAHAMYQLLFDHWPRGYAIPVENFNLLTLQEVGAVMAAERLSTHVMVRDGQDYLGAVAAIMQDAGIMISMQDGEWRFRALRQETIIAQLTEDVTSGPPPERKVNHGDRPATTSSYTFRDRQRGYRTSTIQFNDDGVAELVRRATSRPVDVVGARDFKTASRIAERRGMEDGGTPGVFQVVAAREARDLAPGRVIKVTGIPGSLRVMARTIDFMSSKTTLDCTIASQVTSGSDFQTQPGGGTTGPSTGLYPDPIARVVEVPAHLLLSQTQQLILMPRLRATTATLGADLWISGDGTTYTQVGQDLSACAGGVLLTALSSTDPALMEQGPVFRVVGPDIGTVLDLTTALLDWRKGRLLCVIGNEICFARSVTAIGGDQYRVDGLIRARYDTTRDAHPVGDSILLFERGSLPVIDDPLLAPGATLWSKTQPFASESLDLASMAATSRVLRGKGPVPMPITALRTRNCSNSFRTGESIDLQWCYRSPLVSRTGAGMQGAGERCGESPPRGEFTVRFRTSGGILRRTFASITVPQFTYSNSQMVGDFLSEPTSLKCSVEEVLGGYSSGELEITIVRA